jgi:hypothetical protein
MAVDLVADRRRGRRDLTPSRALASSVTAAVVSMSGRPSTSTPIDLLEIRAVATLKIISTPGNAHPRVRKTRRRLIVCAFANNPG